VCIVLGKHGAGEAANAVEEKIAMEVRPCLSDWDSHSNRFLCRHWIIPGRKVLVEWKEDLDGMLCI
jgi:hypothetical protein